MDSSFLSPYNDRTFAPKNAPDIDPETHTRSRKHQIWLDDEGYEYIPVTGPRLRALYDNHEFDIASNHVFFDYRIPKHLRAKHNKLENGLQELQRDTSVTLTKKRMRLSKEESQRQKKFLIRQFDMYARNHTRSLLESRGYMNVDPDSLEFKVVLNIVAQGLARYLTPEWLENGLRYKFVVLESFMLSHRSGIDFDYDIDVDTDSNSRKGLGSDNVGICVLQMYPPKQSLIFEDESGDFRDQERMLVPDLGAFVPMQNISEMDNVMLVHGMSRRTLILDIIQEKFMDPFVKKPTPTPKKV
ncbi:MAG: hypothetical protein ACTSUE_17070 [Promethearchaeota archaeon]